MVTRAQPIRIFSDVVQKRNNLKKNLPYFVDNIVLNICEKFHYNRTLRYRVIDNIEATFEFQPCNNYFVTPWLTLQEVTRQQYEILLLGPLPTEQTHQTLCAFSAE